MEQPPHSIPFGELGQRLEEACSNLNIVSDNRKRKEYEAFIQHCQNQPQPYDFCRHILEGQQYSVVTKFFASNIIKKSIVQEWNVLDVNMKLNLSQYLFEFITSVVLGGNVPSSVSSGAGSIQPPSILQQIINQLLQGYSIIQKRSWIDESNGGKQFRDMTFTHIQQLLGQDSPKVQQMSQNLALQLLLNLITEFSLGGSSSEIGMNWEFHEKSRVMFQQDFLSNCFVLGCDILKRTLSIQDESIFCGVLTSDISELLKMSVNALQLIREVLCWDFSPFNEMSSLKTIISTKIYKNKYASSGGGSGSAFLEQGKISPSSKEWKERFSNTDILTLLIQFHQKFRQGLVITSSNQNALDAELFIRITHQVRLCLTQWCNISIDCFLDRNSKLNFFIGLLSSIFSLMNSALSNVTSLEFSLICGQEIYDCSQCIYRLFTNFKFSTFIEIYYHLNQTQFMEIIRHLTNATIRTVEIAYKFNDQFILDSLTTLLECWSLICESLTSARHSPSGLYLDMKGSDFVRQCCFEIYKSYVDLKIPEQRPHNVEDEEDDENEESVIDEQLNAIGVLGRQLADPSLQLLYHKFSTRFSQLQTLFGQNLQNRQLDGLWEDFEWIIEIGGYTIADHVEGEAPTLPLEIVDLTDGSSDNIFFTFINSIIKFSQFELICLSKSPQMLSPRIAKILMWFFWRWAQSYLMPEISHHTESISKSILQMYGEQSENGVKMVDYLLQKISHNLIHWSSEHETCLESIRLFMTMSRKKSIQKCLIRTNTFVEMVKNDYNTYHTLQKASNSIKGKLTQCILSCCASFIKKIQDKKDFEELHQVLKLILTPLRDQFNSILSRSDFTEVYQQPQIMEQLDYCFEKFLGIAKGSTNSDIAEIMLSFFESEKILLNLIKLLNQYHLHEQFVTLILRVFKNCVKSFIPHVTKNQCKSLFHSCLTMIQNFVQQTCKKSVNGNSKRRNALDDLSEEEQYKDLLILLKMLTFMISKDFLDFSDFDSAGVFSAEIHVKSDENAENAIVNYVFQGIHLMLPLITIELLDFSPLRKQYFKLIGFMMEMYPEKVALLPNQLFNHFINSLVFGIRHFELDIAQDSFDAIHSLCSHRAKYPIAFGQQDQSFVGMLIKECINILLYEVFDIELLHNISDTLYGLILWDQNSFRIAVEGVLMNEPNHSQDIAQGFQLLLEGITELDLRAKNLRTFFENLEKVVSKLRCFTRRK